MAALGLTVLGNSQLEDSSDSIGKHYGCEEGCTQGSDPELVDFFGS